MMGIQLHLLVLFTFIVNIKLCVGYRLPAFSWDNLGGMTAFHSSNVDGLYPPDQIKTLARYPLITIEKYQALHKIIHKNYSWETCQKGANCTLCGCCSEDYILDLAKAVKAINPKAIILMYTNTMLSYPFYRAGHNFAQHPDWWLRNISGEIDYSGHGTWFNYDHSQPEASAFWATQCTNVTKGHGKGYIDGCFMDGCTRTPKNLAPNVSAAYLPTKIKTMQKMQKEVPGPLICGSNGKVVDGIAASQIQNWGERGGNYSQREIPMLQNAVAKGVLFEAHGHCPSNMSDPKTITSLAAFLVAAGNYSYYMCGGWNSYKPQWYPVYDFPLGEPTGPSILKKGVYTRKFKSGTAVTFNTNTETGSIKWSATNNDSQ